MAVNLPPDVIKVLSFHGEVEFWGGGTPEGACKAAVAPFDDEVVAFVRPGSPCEQAMLRSPRVQLNARHPDGEYSLRMEGRGVAGPLIGRHPNRGALEPWLPEGVRSTRFIAATFVPETIELVRQEDGETQRYFGPTPAGKARPSAALIWARTAFGGIFGLGAAVGMITVWLWLAVQGATFPWRPLALLLMSCAVLGQVGGARLLVTTFGFHQWRSGKARRAEAGQLVHGFLAPGQTRLAGVVALSLSALALGVVFSLWPAQAGWVALLSSGGWLLGPVWAINLASGRREHVS